MVLRTTNHPGVRKPCRISLLGHELKQQLVHRHLWYTHTHTFADIPKLTSLSVCVGIAEKTMRNVRRSERCEIKLIKSVGKLFWNIAGKTQRSGDG